MKNTTTSTKGNPPRSLNESGKCQVAAELLAGTIETGTAIGNGHTPRTVSTVSWINVKWRNNEH